MGEQLTNRTTAAIALSLLALTLFGFMGLIIKHLSPHYSAAELSAWRNLFGLIPAGISLWYASAWHAANRPLIIRQWALAASRGLMATIAQLLFYTALGSIAFATVNTLGNSTALFMTALAVPLLGERVGLPRWSAVGIGFLGVILILKPGSDAFSPAAIAAIGSAFFYALMGVLARRIDPQVPSALINLYSSAFAFLGSLLLVLVMGGFSPLRSVEDFAWIVGSGLFGGLAVFCLTVSFRMAEQSDLAPFTYFSIPITFLMGWVFYDEAPIDSLFPGALLIIAGGLIVVMRERRARKLSVPTETGGSATG